MRGIIPRTTAPQLLPAPTERYEFLNSGQVMLNSKGAGSSNDEAGYAGPLKGLMIAILVAIFTASCGGGGGSGNPTKTPLQISLNAARTSGVAPLAVFFDASGTTSSVTSRPFHDIEYQWDFGDTASGNWTTGSRAGTSSRNAASGPVAAHVFESPGTYNVVVTALDGTNTASRSIQIVVANPTTAFSGTDTICFSTSGATANCPGTTITTSDFNLAINTYAGTNKRLLFRRGEIFTATSTSIISSTGPGLLGAYGTSPTLPQINASGSAFNGDKPILQFGDNFTVAQKDWRVMDLSFNGNANAEAIGLGGGFDQITLLRVRATNCGDACVFFNSAKLTGGVNPHLFDQAAIVDSTIIGPTQNWSVFFNGTNFALLGNLLDNQLSGSHTLRISIGINGVVSNNTLANNGPGSAGTHVFKLHGPPFDTATDGVPANSSTTKVVVSDNKLTPGGASTNNWTFSLDPQDSAKNEHITNIIVERNQFFGGANTSLCISMQAIDATVRNNIANTTASIPGGTFIEVAKRSSGAPAPNRIGIYNNTMFSNANNVSTGGGAFISITSSVTASGATIKNNLGYAPSATSGVMISNLANAIASNNSGDSGLPGIGTNPNFVSSTPSTPSQFVIQNGSYAKGNGASVPVFSDFFGTSRPQMGMDVGFAEIP